MKNALRLALVIVSGLLLSGCFGSGGGGEEKEVKAKEIASDLLPYVELIPRSDMHRLDVGIYNLKSKRIDYQIIYTLNVKGNPVERGFGGRDVRISGNELVKNGDFAIVFGSESSGKFKYDEGVTEGQVQVSYRDEKGKVTGRSSSDWRLFDGKLASSFASKDSKFSYTINSKTKDVFLVMHTFSTPSLFSGKIKSGPYGVFTSGKSNLAGKVSFTADAGKVTYFDKASKSWKEAASKSENGQVTAAVPGMTVFLLAE